MEKIIKTSNIIGKVLNVLFWIAIVIVGVALVAVVAVMIVGDSIDLGGNWTMSLGNYNLVLNGELSTAQMKSLMVVTAVNLVIFGLGACVSLRILRGIFRSMSQGQPFDGSVSKDIRKLAFVELFFGLAAMILQLITNVVVFNAFDVPALFDPEKVSSCGLSVVADGGVIIVFVLLLLLSHIFKYGEELQQLSDETL